MKTTTKRNILEMEIEELVEENLTKEEWKDVLQVMEFLEREEIQIQRIVKNVIDLKTQTLSLMSGFMTPQMPKNFPIIEGEISERQEKQIKKNDEI